MEHVNKFLDAMGAHVGDRDLCLCEFSKSLSNRAYRCELRITILDLHNTCQCTGEDLMIYVKRFKDLALDCYEGHAESFMEICINNITAISVKAISIGKSVAKSAKRKATAHTLVVSVYGQGQGQKKRDYDTASPLPIPLTIKELDVLLDQWITNGAITLPQSHHKPNDDDKHNPKYCRYYHFVHHVTMDCFSLRRIYHRRVSEALLEVPNRRQRVDEDPFLLYNQSVVKVLTHVESIRLGFTTKAQQRAMEAILSITNETRGECLNVETHASHAYLESSNAINSIGVRPTLVDTRSSLNLIPLSTIIIARSPQQRIVSEAECFTLEAGNKILTGHLNSFGKADHLVPLNKLPTLHEAQPVITSLEFFEAIALRDDLVNPKHAHIRLDPALVAHSLNIDPNMKPVVQPNRAFHLEVTLKIKEEVEKLLAIRCCIDFRDLNKACPKDEFSVLNMDVLMDNIVGSKMYSHMDGSSGYNQVSMCPNNAEKTIFHTPIGLILGQVQGSFVVQKEHLAPYRSYSHNLEQSFTSIRNEQVPQMKNRLADSLATIASKLHHLSLTESQKVMVEIHAGECGKHQGWRKLHEQLLAHGYYWLSMKQDTANFIQQCHTCQVHLSLIHSHPNLLQDMKTPWPFHTWGLDLIGPIHPSSEGYI
ncbi:hypothetical protein SLEP1_g50439 [Rubroshorea leprosula]|uniref:Integrase zinc-binding domain-containing protein n=1 Tax=Rubroshorea leprosula TaxID=152421 RepID=A0AAV5M225_9ROSI|nr:hypothetical protein SLEP1_g50439 [Rubroshorea leprosula]